MSQSPTKQPNHTPRDTKSYSCVICRHRKIKCDRRAPCANCIKADAECRFVPPVRGKRKRTKPMREGLHAKLRRYEDLLKSHGVIIAAVDESDGAEDENGDGDSNEDGATPQSRDAEDVGPPKKQPNDRNDPFELDVTEPKLVTRGGNSRYFDSGLWFNLGESMRNQFHHPDDFAHTGTTSEPPNQDCNLFLHSLEHNNCSGNPNLADHYPPLPIMQKLKDKFVSQVDSLLKILHMPTFWASVRLALQHPKDVSSSLQAAIFCFCLATISSLSDEDCLGIFGAPKQEVHSRYRMLARQALVYAGFLHTSSLLTLQAFSLFMMGVRTDQRHDTQYMLSAVAVRLARKMGLHRDGESLGLSPFETEMRRLLWWHVVHVDFRNADLLSTRPSLDLFVGDTKKPLNILDEDINPDMVDPPPERRGITPVVLCLVRCEIMEFLGKLSSSFPHDARWDLLMSPDFTLTQKESLISRVEDIFESRYLRYCDPSESLHTLVSMMIRSSLCKMRLHAHSPRQYTRRGVPVPRSEREVVFTNATKLLEYATLARKNVELQKYNWRISTSYLWDTILHVLIEVRHRKTGPEVDRVWRLLEVTYSQYPDAFSKYNGAIYAALSKWTLEVWDDYVAAARAEGLEEPEAPEYIQSMRKHQASDASPETKDSVESTPVNEEYYVGDNKSPGDQGILDSYNFSSLMSFEMDPNEWIQWELLTSEQSGFGQADGTWR